MIAIEGGSFLDEHVLGPNEWHEIGNYWIDRTEVTVAAYTQCVDEQSCTAPDDAEGCNWGDDVADHPINCVTLSQADAFCSWADKRLPTQWEWEWAARDRFAERDYPWGYINEPATCEFAVMDDAQLGEGCGSGGTAPVGSKPAGNTDSGLVDMAGNVAELTSSDHLLDGFKVIRGGDFSVGAGSSESLFRTYSPATHTPTVQEPTTGFRCVRDQP